MPDRIRFHLDEHIPDAVFLALRKYGIDVTTTVNAGLKGRSDAQHLEYARETNRAILTHDADFLRIADVDKKHHGVIYCPMAARSVGEIVRGLILIYEVLEAHELAGQVEYL